MGFLKDLVTNVHDAWNAQHGKKTYAEQHAEQQAREAAQRARDVHQHIAADRRSVQFDGAFDPAAITQHENWAALSHQQIFETNKGLSQNQASQVARAWKDIADDLRAIGPDLEGDVDKALQGGGWEGHAADAARQSAEPLVQWSGNHADALQLTGDQIDQAATAAGQCKGTVPPPQQHSVGRTVAAAVLAVPNIEQGGNADGTRQMQERQEAERHAQQTMGRVMTPAYQQADTATPSFQHVDGQHAPPAPVSEPPAPGLPPSPGHHGVASAHGGSGRGGSTHGAGGPDRKSVV